MKTLSKKQKEQPRFRTILEYEANFTESHSKLTKLMVKDLVATATEMAGKKK